MLILAGPDCLINKHGFSLRPIAYIGLFSYPLYLWHWPLLSFASISQNTNAEVTLVLLGVSVILAILTYEFIEKPCQRQPLKISTGGLLTTMGIAAFAGMFVYLNAGVFARYPSDVAQILSTMKYDYGSDARLHKCWLEEDRGPQEFASECRGHREPASTLLWGDSYAARLYPGYRTVFAHSDVAQLARSSCPPLQLLSVTENCRLSNERVFQEVRRTRPKRLILFAYWVYYADNWNSDSSQGRALSDQLARLASLNLEDVVVIGPAPLWKPNLPIIIYNVWSKTNAVPLYNSTNVTRSIDADRKLGQSVEKAGARYISLLELLCKDTGCLTHVPGSPGSLLSYDGGHLTTPGAKFVVESLRSRGIL